jgi:hypothetical protein
MSSPAAAAAAADSLPLTRFAGDVYRVCDAITAEQPERCASFSRLHQLIGELI